MSLTTFNPQWDPFMHIEDMMRNLPATLHMSNRQSFAPALDMYEENDAIVVESPLPGINPAEVEVSVEKGRLTIKGKSSKEHEVEEKNYYHKETRSGSFYRQILLPTPVKEDEVTAQYDNGVLKIELPKLNRQTERAKKINVTVVKNKGKRNK